MLRTRHARCYAALCARANENFYGPEQLVWARQVNAERDNLRAALANAIDAGDAELAVELVANQPHQERPKARPGRSSTCRYRRCWICPAQNGNRDIRKCW